MSRRQAQEQNKQLRNINRISWNSILKVVFNVCLNSAHHTVKRNSETSPGPQEQGKGDGMIRWGKANYKGSTVEMLKAKTIKCTHI